MISILIINFSFNFRGDYVFEMTGTWRVKYLFQNEVFEGYARDGIELEMNDEHEKIAVQLQIKKVVDNDFNHLFYLEVKNDGRFVSFSCAPNCAIKVVSIFC